MKSQTVLIMVLILGLLLVGCTANDPDLSPIAAVDSEPDMEDPSTSDTAAISSETQLVTEPEEDNMISSTMEEKTTLPGIEIYNFGESEPNWYTVDDRVMGGVSSSTVEISEPGILRFAGTMSLDSNGGFSSARSDWNSLDLDRYDGVLVRALGDGNMYRLRIRTAETGSEVSFNAIFETSGEDWQIFYIPFDGMVPTYRGFKIDVGRLNPANIGSFGFMLSDKQPGDFELKVDWIRAVSEETLFDLKSN